MDRELFLKKVSEVLKTPLHSFELRENQIPEWDSFGQLKIFMAIEEAFGCRFSTEDIQSLTDLESIYQRALKLTSL